MTTLTPAQRVVNNIRTNIIQHQAQMALLTNQALEAFTNGIPSQGDVPAISEVDLQEAAGDGLETLLLKLRALNAAVGA